jgi:Rps23 Pro-64 3,4-dihydroxylase Tpa1-like proline 4-hydroxylase
MPVVQTRSLEGQDFYVVDGLFKPDFVKLLHELAKQLPFTMSDHDSADTRHVRHWRRDFTPEALIANPVIRVWRQEVEDQTAELYPDAKGDLREAYCNNHGYGDHQHPHVDGVTGLTVLYYVNADWQPDWQGETVLFDTAQDAHHAVAPHPGRLLIFPSNILHRGGTPSRTCSERRLVFVLKFKGYEE